MVLRNGCVNPISSQRNSAQYVLFYLREAFRTLAEREIAGISGVLVSFIFHILLNRVSNHVSNHVSNCVL